MLRQRLSKAGQRFSGREIIRVKDRIMSSLNILIDTLLTLSAFLRPSVERGS